MKNNKKWLLGLIALCFVASTSLLGYVVGVHVGEAQAKSTIQGCRKKVEAVGASGSDKQQPSIPTTNRVARVESACFCYSDTNQGTIKFTCTEPPNLEDLRRQIKFSPEVRDFSVTCERSSSWLYRDRRERFVLGLTSSDFKFRQPYTLTIGRGLAFVNGSTLAADYRVTLERPDIRPNVSLVHAGRYLPPTGDRIVAIDTVNVSQPKCSTWRVLPENIVQLLAREEGQYTKSMDWWRSSIGADSDATEELSCVPFTWQIDVEKKMNVHVTQPVALTSSQGVVSNGVYLLGVVDADAKPNVHYGADYAEYRLVCVSDLALSARQDDYGLRVWVTSLTTGRPVTDADLTLYAANRMLLASGKTDGNGEAILTGWDSRYEPFALIATRQTNSDVTFMALKESVRLDESLPTGARPAYLEPEACQAFVTTDRGIYRPEEKIMVSILLRDGTGQAPKPFPVEICLIDPAERVVFESHKISDAFGAIVEEEFFAPRNRPTGKWKIVVAIPGDKKRTLGSREIKIEEFVPPQVRVKLADLPTAKTPATNIVYKVAAEHLFGGPAKYITAESLVSFTDVDFTPEYWKGYRFGDQNRGLTPNYTRLPGVFTDDHGEASFTVGMNPEWGEPKAAVRVTIQGSCFETGSRPSVTRESRIIHKYPYYIGTNIPRYQRQKSGNGNFSVVLVNPDGTAHAEARELKAQLWKCEWVCNLTKTMRGNHYSWESQRVRRPIGEVQTICVSEKGRGSFDIPLSGSGDYEWVVADETRGLSHTAAFWISADGDDEVRASMANPTMLALSCDKSVYHEGERPRITLKCPFRGFAWLTVSREKTLYTHVIEVTNLTQVVELEALDGTWAPNIDVAVSLVQSLDVSKNYLATRVHGVLPIRIRTRDSELPTQVDATVVCSEQGGSRVHVKVTAKSDVAEGARAVITVVDEGIHLLTAEKVPDPIGHFSRIREGKHPFFDIYRRLLPVLESDLKISGVKTGGDDLAGMMNRVSPVPTRRFKPLSQWQIDVPLTNGVATTTFCLPEFVGEVRVTALVYNQRGTGCAAFPCKVCPKLVMQPDAPRFVAPGDEFYLTLSLHNRSGAAGEIDYEISSTGAVAVVTNGFGRVHLDCDASHVSHIRAIAQATCGQGVITYRTHGLGETHVGVIELPVRPAVAWNEQANVVLLRAGESLVLTNAAAVLPDTTYRKVVVQNSPLAELQSAYDALAEYPYGCLEQTTSQMFPLLTSIGSKTDTVSIVQAGVSRVVSMIRATDFVMWPDCTMAPWDREVSVYAAHFLIEAERIPAIHVPKSAQDSVLRFLKRWANDANRDIAAYACHTLALAGHPDVGRMIELYQQRDALSLLARVRLARGFLHAGHPRSAHELVDGAALDPHDIREAAFALLTILEMSADDPRLPRLVVYLQRQRDPMRYNWHTTCDNAHALLALGAYYRTQRVRAGEVSIMIRTEDSVQSLTNNNAWTCIGGANVTIDNRGTSDAYLSYRSRTLPDPATVTNQHHLISVSRRFLTGEGLPANLDNLTRGELLIGEISLSSDRNYDFRDLVVEELLPACLEPDSKNVAQIFARCHGSGNTSWVLRSDVRDDRIVAFSKPFTMGPTQLEKERFVFYYAVRVITPGKFILPGTRVEAMYAPEINAQMAPSQICVRQ